MIFFSVCCSSLESRFRGVVGPLAEPLDLGHSDPCVAEKVKHCVQLNNAAEKRPEIASFDHGKVEGEQDRGEKSDGHFEVAVDEETLDVGARTFEQSEAGDEGEHGECEHEHEFVRRCHDHGEHDEAQTAENSGENESNDSVRVALFIWQAVENAEPALGLGLTTPKYEVFGTLHFLADSLGEA